MDSEGLGGTTTTRSALPTRSCSRALRSFEVTDSTCRNWVISSGTTASGLCSWPCGTTMIVRGRGAPTVSPTPNRNRTRNGPSTSTAMSHGWRQTSAAHWLKKLSVRVRVLATALRLASDDALEDVVEGRNRRPDRLHDAAATLQGLGDRRGGRGSVLDHHTHGAAVRPADSPHLRQFAHGGHRLSG